MKSVLLSIYPEWCKKICHKIGTDKNGKPIYEKSIEVRKTKPSIPTPFKVYIYCTKGKNGYEWLYRFDNNGYGKAQSWHGKVVGEFICDRIDRIEKRGINNNFDYCYLSLNEWGNDDIEIEIKDIQKSCISKSELNAYGENSSCLYGLHITDLKIYDKPKELREFYKPCPDPFNYCTTCKHCIRIIPPDEEEYALYHGGQFDYWEEHCMNTLTRPPQSWCYVQEMEDNND